MRLWLDEVAAEMARRLQQAQGATKHDKLAAERPATRKLKIDRERASQIATELLITALRNGLAVSSARPRFQELRGGNTALQVSIASMQVEFVFKQDTDPKLVREARTIEDLRADPRLGHFCHRLPQVYALYDKEPPYAYLMEFFDDREYPSLKQIFFDRDRFDLPLPTEAADLVAYVFDALAEAYLNSRDSRQQVRMMGEAYYARMATALEKASQLSPDFQSCPLLLNGRHVRPWRDLLNELKRKRALLDQIAAPFVTVVHGDPNPGNILVKRDGARVRDVKFIDLKDWKVGDYVFDLAKLSHFLLHTGPVEELKSFSEEGLNRTPENLSYNYSTAIDAPIQEAVKVIEKKMQEIAGHLEDPEWQLRYRLALASNLLGLVPSRYIDGLQQEAFILYADGMQYLESFMADFDLNN